MIMSNRFGKKGLMSNIALEQNETPVNEDPIESLDIDNADDSDSLDDCLDVVSALEEYRALLSTDTSEGYLESNGASLLKVGLERQYKRAQIDEIPTISIESFKNATMRPDATRIAIEGIGEAIKAVWAKIVAMLKKMYEWVTTAFSKLFSRMGYLEKRAIKLADIASKVKGKPNKEKINSGDVPVILMRDLKYDDKVDQNVIHSTQIVKDMLVKIATPYTKEYSHDCAKILSEIGKEFANGNVDILELNPHPVPDFTLIYDTAKEGFHDLPENVKLYKSKQLPGNKALFTLTVTNKVKGVEAAKLLRYVDFIKLGDYDCSIKSILYTLKDVPVLLSQECIQVSKLVEEIAKEFYKSEESFNQYAKITKAALTEAEKLAMKANTETITSEAHAVFRTLRGKITAQSEVFQYIWSFCDAALVYVETSLKEYGDAKVGF